MFHLLYSEILVISSIRAVITASHAVSGVNCSGHENISLARRSYSRAYVEIDILPTLNKLEHL